MCLMVICISSLEKCLLRSFTQFKIRLSFDDCVVRVLIYSGLLLFIIKSCATDSSWPHGLQHTRLPCPSLVSWSLPKFMPIEAVMPSNHLILCHTLLLLPSIFPSIKVFSNELALCIMWPKYWSFSFSTSPSKEYSGLISFKIDWFISLLSKRLSKVLSNNTVQKH